MKNGIQTVKKWKFKIHELNEINRHWLYFGIVTSTKYKEGWFGGRPRDHNKDNYYSYAFGVSRWDQIVGLYVLIYVIVRALQILIGIKVMKCV